MAMYGGNRFKNATASATPQFAAATAKQNELEQQAKAQANALRSQNIMGAANIYNKGMGDNTPIADKIGSWFGEEAAAEKGVEAGAETMAAETQAVAGGEASITLAQEAQQAQQALQAAQAAQAAGAATAAEVAAAEALAAKTAAAQAASAKASSSNPVTAAIMAAYMYEQGAHKSGRRSDDDVEYRKNLMTGDVARQDLNILGDKIGGAGGEGISAIGDSVSPEEVAENVKSPNRNVFKPTIKALRTSKLDPTTWF